jgi:hypothetical protein
MMRKKQFLMFLLIGAFFMHLAHQLFPHHHHTEEVTVATHSHGLDSKHHHHHADTENKKQEQQKNWLDELLSFINHGTTDNPVQSGNQIKADFCKALTIVPSVFDGLLEISVPDSQIIFSYAPPEQKHQQHVILFKSRRGPPAMA